jgi:hypothetical protein
MGGLDMLKKEEDSQTFTVSFTSSSSSSSSSGITVLGGHSFFENCPPLFSVLRLSPPVPHDHIL